MKLGLEGQTALVTGASSGIGRAVALMFAAEGLRVVATARDANRLAETMDGIEARGRRGVAVIADLATGDGVDRVAKVAQAASVDVLVCCAGRSERMGRGEADRWDEVMALQFTSVRLLAEAVLPGMQERGWGRIVAIGGTLEPADVVNGSTVAKAAALAWAKGLSREVGRCGITVNTVVPGRIVTKQVVELLHPEPKDRAAFAQANIPVGEFGKPDDVAHLVCFLASDLARYISGEIVHIDGGLRRYAF
ncbi:MAG: SDR family NAD(P)-dependent oxidoreductase [Gaiellales bacterium]